MGSQDDSYFEQRAQDGEKQAFFAINSNWPAEWLERLTSIALEEGFKPIYYSGVGKGMVPAERASNTLDKEIREDFYFSKTIIAYFGQPRRGSNSDDHWVLHHLRHVVDHDRNILIYVSPDYPISILAQNGVVVQPKVVSGADEFARVLRDDLKKIVSQWR